MNTPGAPDSGQSTMPAPSWWQRGKKRWRAAVLTEQARDAAVVAAAPRAIQLTIVDNGPKDGWKWLTWGYDPDHTRLLAGAIEGSVVPYGMKNAYETLAKAREGGIAAIRQAGWDGLIVLDEKSPTS